MESEASLVERLRDRVVGGLHRGTLHAGDRLEGVREIARRARMNARAVAKAYRTLEAEGLVEVRGRSGVYVAPQERREGEMLPETMRWMTGVVVESWRRMIRIPEFPGFVRRCTGAVRPRCALVESVEDTATALSVELQWDLGFDVQIFSLDPPESQDSAEQLMGGSQDVDLFVTTSFYARAVRGIAEKLEKPVVMLTTHPQFDAAVRRRLEDGRLTIVAVDPRFGERMRAIYGEDRSDDRIRVILADDAEAIAKLDPAEPVLLTRAAHERLGDVDLTLLFPHSPSFSPDSARELAEVLIRLNQEAERL